MIFLFDMTLGELDAGLSEECELAITKLVLAHREGSHLLVIPRITVQELLRFEWSPVIRATLQRIGNDFTQIGSILRTSSHVLCVRANAARAQATPGNYRIIELRDIVRYKLHLPTILLVENATNDGRFFEVLLETISRRLGSRGICLEASHGGGDDMPSTFSRQIEQQRFVVCIIDSDKSSPFCASPSKYKKLLSLQDQTNWQYSVIIMLECHEIENLLTPDTNYAFEVCIRVQT